MASYDAIVVGAGHNGLVAGAYLAKAGLKTLILERRGLVGGACVTEEIHPGFHVSTLSYTCGLFRPEIKEELQLAKFGLEEHVLGQFDRAFLTQKFGRRLGLLARQIQAGQAVGQPVRHRLDAAPHLRVHVGGRDGEHAARDRRVQVLS